ncbi:MAG: hypothetical protein ACKV19_23075 [Verrucomicrobiales bacterium]
MKPTPVVFGTAVVWIAAGTFLHADLVTPNTPPPEPLPTEVRPAEPVVEPDSSASVGDPANTKSPAGVEAPPTLQAADRLGPDWVRGPAHRVRSAVPTDGYMAHFTIDSDFGTFQCAGADRARQRIHEIEAISRLVAESKGDVSPRRLKGRASNPSRPSKTSSMIPRVL